MPFRAFSSHRQPSASRYDFRESRYDFPGVDHEGRQTFRLPPNHVKYLSVEYLLISKKKKKSGALA